MSSAEPVVVTAIFRPIEGTADRVLDTLRVAIPKVHEEEGCLLYSIQDAPDGTIVMIEKWQNAELLDQHGDSPAVAELIAALDGLLSAPVEVTRLSAIPLGDAAKGAL